VTTTGTIILGADHHPNYRFRIEFPVEDDEGDTILSEYIGSVSGGEENERHRVHRRVSEGRKLFLKH
jgi:hypothetical protein